MNKSTKQHFYRSLLALTLLAALLLGGLVGQLAPREPETSGQYELKRTMTFSWLRMLDGRYLNLSRSKPIGSTRGWFTDRYFALYDTIERQELQLRLPLAEYSKQHAEYLPELDFKTHSIAPELVHYDGDAALVVIKNYNIRDRARTRLHYHLARLKDGDLEPLQKLASLRGDGSEHWQHIGYDRENHIYYSMIQKRSGSLAQGGPGSLELLAVDCRGKLKRTQLDLQPIQKAGAGALYGFLHRNAKSILFVEHYETRHGRLNRPANLILYNVAEASFKKLPGYPALYAIASSSEGWLLSSLETRELLLLDSLSGAIRHKTRLPAPSYQLLVHSDQQQLLVPASGSSYWNILAIPDLQQKQRQAVPAFAKSRAVKPELVFINSRNELWMPAFDRGGIQDRSRLLRLNWP